MKRDNNEKKRCNNVNVTKTNKRTQKHTHTHTSKMNEICAVFTTTKTQMIKKE